MATRGEGNRRLMPVTGRWMLYLIDKSYFNEKIEMSNKVGKKGQVVIPKKIRDQLGVEPGSLTVQTVVDGHLEIHFFPPEHNRSLLGILAPYTDVVIQPGEEWRKAKEQAWEAAAREKMEKLGTGL